MSHIPPMYIINFLLMETIHYYELMSVQKNIDEQKKKIKQITAEEDEYSKRNNELRKNEIQLNQELDNIESIVASNIEKCKKFKLEVIYVCYI